MTTIKLSQAVTSFDPLRRLFIEKMPLKTSLLLSKIASPLESEIKRFQDLRSEKENQYNAQKDYETGELSQELTDQFNQEITDALSIDIDLPFIRFKVSDFGDISLSASDLITLNWLINTDE